MSELWAQTATELAGTIVRKEASSREVVDAHLQRIEALNPSLNAIVEVLADSARSAADAADAALAAGEPIGPLHGVPVTVKQNIDVGNTATTLGLAAFAEAIAPADGPPVARLREAGAIVLGRTNLPDIALRWHTDSSIAGPTRNPWSSKATPGGSSGGEGVALATGMSPLGVGTDLGGSVRIPSAANGTVGLKTTVGRIADVSAVAPPRTPAFELMDTTGPMARSVADLRVALEVMRAPDPDGRDPRWRAEPLGDGTPTAVAVYMPPGTTDDVRAAVERTAATLDTAGWKTDAVEPPGIANGTEVALALLGHDVRQTLPLLRDVCGAGTLAFLDIMLTVLPELDDEGVTQLLAARDQMLAGWTEMQQTFALVLTPVFARPPFAPDADLTDPIAVVESLACVPIVNLLGLPAAAVPAGIGATGLPIGLQLIGPAWREDLCLAAASVIERASAPLTPIDPRA